MSAYISHPDRMGIPNKTELFFPGLIHCHISPIPSLKNIAMFIGKLWPLQGGKPCCQPASQRQFHKQARAKKARKNRSSMLRLLRSGPTTFINRCPPGQYVNSRSRVLLLLTGRFRGRVFHQSVNQPHCQGLPEVWRGSPSDEPGNKNRQHTRCQGGSGDAFVIVFSPMECFI